MSPKTSTHPAAPAAAPVKSVPTAAAAAKPPPAAAARLVSASQLATAFDGQLERRRMSVGHKIGLAAVAGLVVLLPLVYFGIIAGTAWLVWYHITHSVAMFHAVPKGRIVILVGVIYVAPILAGVLLVLAMVLPLFWRSRSGPRPFWVDRREQPLLYAYVDKLCDAMRAPRPARIDIVAAATASAHVDNGVLGLLRRRLVLTIGLPLARSLDLRQFTGVLAHELGHFTQGSSMRLSYVVHNVNRWFARMAWGRSGIDDMVDGMINPGEHSHWILFVIGLLCKLVIGVARLTLKLLAIVSHALTMNLSRQDEYDADWQAARIVGGETMGQALEATPFIDAAFTLAIERARLGWARRQLPDDLVAFTRYVHKQLPAEIKDKIAAALLTSEASWFDTHPPLYQRVAAMKKSKLQGVLKLNARATCLFREFDELSKIATIDLYQSILGNALQPEHLVEVKLDAPQAAASSAAAMQAKVPK